MVDPTRSFVARESDGAASHATEEGACVSTLTASRRTMMPDMIKLSELCSSWTRSFLRIVRG